MSLLCKFGFHSYVDSPIGMNWRMSTDKSIEWTKKHFGWHEFRICKGCDKMQQREVRTWYGRITDNEFDVLHEMEGQNDFFEYFQLVFCDLKLPNKSRLEEALKQSISLLMQTTEFEVLESFKLKVSELQKVLEEPKTQSCY